MILLSASLAVLFFVLAFSASGTIESGSANLRKIRQIVAVLRDEGRTDLEKERIVRRGSGVLLRGSVGIFLRFALSLLTGLLPVAAFHLSGLAAIEAVMSLLLSWQFLIASGTILALFLWLGQLLRSRSRAS